MTIQYKLDDLLTLEQMAAKLHLKVRTMYDWVYKRKIPFTRLGQRLYVSAGVVEALLNANAKLPAQSALSVLSPSGKEVLRKGVNDEQKS